MDKVIEKGCRTVAVEMVQLERPELDFDHAIDHRQHAVPVTLLHRPGKFSIHLEAVGDVMREELGLSRKEWDEAGFEVRVELELETESVLFSVGVKDDD